MSKLHIIEQPLPDAGSFSPGYAPRIVWHTTEGRHYPGVSLYHNTHPTFTCDFKNRKTYQHVSMFRAAMALENHPGGVETNHAHAIQIELVGFTAEDGEWTAADYAYIRQLARHIERATGVKRHAATPWDQARFTYEHWHRFDGHCGHMHVPENTHGDPGFHFKAHKVL